MTVYENELQKLKAHDEVQDSRNLHGYMFITTAGHGYLVVPKRHGDHSTALKIVRASGYGFIGKEAVYLEEDKEASDFLLEVGKLCERDCMTCERTFITTTDWTARETCYTCRQAQ